MDSTRMTQHGRWSGKIEFKNKTIDLSDKNYYGTRDRSWGVRPVGQPDTQMLVPVQKDTNKELA